MMDVNNPDWAPSLKLVYERISKRSLTSRSERYERALKRRILCSQESMEKTITEDLGNEEMEANLEIDRANEATVILNVVFVDKGFQNGSFQTATMKHSNIQNSTIAQTQHTVV